LLQTADAADDAALAVTKDAFYFLQENGYINFGVLPGGPNRHAQGLFTQQQC
jgi:hypothetical protein